MDRESYGVFDRSGWNTVEEFPFTIGQEYQTHWATVHPARHTYDFSAIDAQLQFAYEQQAPPMYAYEQQQAVPQYQYAQPAQAAYDNQPTNNFMCMHLYFGEWHHFREWTGRCA